jgi:hypothetical protein
MREGDDVVKAYEGHRLIWVKGCEGGRSDPRRSLRNARFRKRSY